MTGFLITEKKRCGKAAGLFETVGLVISLKARGGLLC